MHTLGVKYTTYEAAQRRAGGFNSRFLEVLPCFFPWTITLHTLCSEAQVFVQLSGRGSDRAAEATRLQISRRSSSITLMTPTSGPINKDEAAQVKTSHSGADISETAVHTTQVHHSSLVPEFSALQPTKSDPLVMPGVMLPGPAAPQLAPRPHQGILPSGGQWLL